jgi:hypothetical protein
MVHHLYSNFLQDKKIYNLAQAYWGRLFSKIAQQYDLQLVPYLNDQNGNGQKEYDGNPIFNVLEPSLNRAVRIIQIEPEGEQLDISAWLDTIELAESAPPVQELVIDTVLSKESYAIARKFIIAWLGERITKAEMEHLIETENSPV